MNKFVIINSLMCIQVAGLNPVNCRKENRD